jgi:hypothetical protein
VCPVGYRAQASKGKCCPKCIPEVPSCKVAKFGKQTIIHRSEKGVVCKSLRKFKQTGCNGLCGSSVRATAGNEMFTPKCKCCQPSSVREMKIDMKCTDGSSIKVKFIEITGCSCKITTCSSSFNQKSVQVGDEETPEKNFFDTIEQMKDIDDAASRKDLLNDLALMHLKKAKK